MTIQTIRTIQIIPVEGIPEVGEGDDLAALIAARCTLLDGDVVVVTQKIVSKSEGRVVGIDADRADEERAEWVARETVRVVAKRGDIVIAQTRHGLVCANAGVDVSNVPAGRLSLLPLDPDGSARRIREGLLRLTGVHAGVIVSDTFGRPWRIGQTNVAIGAAGIQPVRNHIGDKDTFGNVLASTEIAVADEIAGAAELVMGKAEGIPVAIVRGAAVAGDGTARLLIRQPEDDLFPNGIVQ